jgi:glycosyltransferase involved in cell wall biosynthesis
MSELPGVSIVIPNYNYARFVGAAIESALTQDHPETEVIVVDDGSTDESRAVVASFGERIRAVYQANGGHVAACNAGWRLARHEIVIFLDSDDLLMADAASTVATAWRPGVSKVQWTLQVVDEAGRSAGSTYPKYPSVLEPRTVRETLLRTGGYPCPPTSGNAFARALLKALFPIKGHDWMDPILTSAAPLYGDVITINRPLGAYRCHSTNDSAQSMITLQRFLRYVENEEKRIAFLEGCCRRMDVTFDPTAARARSVGYQEAHLMLAKLGRGSTLPATRSCIAAIFGSVQSPWQRSIRGLWVAMVALLPLSMARKLIGMRYMPARRPRSIEIITRAFERGRRAGWRPGSHPSGGDSQRCGGEVSVSGRASQTGAKAP